MPVTAVLTTHADALRVRQEFDAGPGLQAGVGERLTRGRHGEL